MNVKFDVDRLVDKHIEIITSKWYRRMVLAALIGGLLFFTGMFAIAIHLIFF